MVHTDKRIIYDIDENCRNLRKLAMAMKPIHKRFGLDFKIGMSERDFNEETGFFDRQLYREAYANNPSDFLISHWDEIEFYPPTSISEECKKEFAEKVKYYARHPTDLPEVVQDEVMLQLHRLMRRIAPDKLTEMTGYNPNEKVTRDKEFEQAEKIKVRFDPANPRLNEIFLAAYCNSPHFRGLAFNKEDYRELFRDSADKEKRRLLGESFYDQGEKESANYVIVTGDPRHAEQTENTIRDNDRQKRSFVMYPEVFVASCEAIHNVLSKLSRKTDSLREELDTLEKAIKQATTQYKDRKLDKTYCEMVVNNRYKDWGISIQRY